MSDIEMVRICAEAMGIHVERVVSNAGVRFRMDPFTIFDPLHDDAQAMALLWLLHDRGAIHIEDGLFIYDWGHDRYAIDFGASKELFRRAIVECVARMGGKDE